MATQDCGCPNQESQTELDNPQDLDLCPPADEVYSEPCRSLNRIDCNVWMGDDIPAYGIVKGKTRLSTIILNLIEQIEALKTP